MNISTFNKLQEILKGNYKNNKVECYSKDVIKEVISILEVYANTWIDTEFYKGLHFNAEPAKRALKLLNKTND